MPILIDGHNLIGHLFSLSLEDPDDEEKLVRVLMSYAARIRNQVTVVFDPGKHFSMPQVHHYGTLEVVFAPQGSTADAVILRRVHGSPNPGEWLVVTSDRELAEAVRRLGARVRSAESLAGELEGAGGAEEVRGDRVLTPTEVEAWLKIFRRRRHAK